MFHGTESQRTPFSKLRSSYPGWSAYGRDHQGRHSNGWRQRSCTIRFHAEFGDWTCNNLNHIDELTWGTQVANIEKIFESIWFGFLLHGCMLHSGWVWAWLKELDLMAPNITHAQRVALLASHRLTLGTPSRETRIVWDEQMLIVVDDIGET